MWAVETLVYFKLRSSTDFCKHLTFTDLCGSLCSILYLIMYIVKGFVSRHLVINSRVKLERQEDASLFSVVPSTVNALFILNAFIPLRA